MTTAWTEKPPGYTDAELDKAEGVYEAMCQVEQTHGAFNLGLPGPVPFPAPPPDRDWDALDVRKVGVANIENMAPDPLKRDIYSRKTRIAAWEQVEREHMWARENNPGYPLKPGIFLFSGAVGAGKTLSAVSYAIDLWRWWAVPVYTNMSALAMFRFLTPAETFDFLNVVPHGSVVLIDEISALAPRGRANSTATRTLAQTAIAIRKHQLKIFVATAAEHQVDTQIRVILDGVISPERWYPQRREVAGYTALGRPKYRRRSLRSGELKYPPFCYLKTQGAQPIWENRRMIEDLLYAGEEAGVTHGEQGQGKLVPCVWPTPRSAWFASRLLDTYDQAPVGKVYDVTGDVMRTHRAQNNDGAEAGSAPDMNANIFAFLAYVGEMVEAQYVDYGTLWQASKIEKLTHTRKAIKEACQELGGSHQRIGTLDMVEKAKDKLRER